MNIGSWGLLIEMAVVSGVLTLLITGLWKCILGYHTYQYVGRKSGMTFNKDTRGVSGTMRTVYRCGRCKKFKPAEPQDYE